MRRRPGCSAAAVAALLLTVLVTNAHALGLDRIAGSDRFSTAVEIAERFDAGVPVVYVATGSTAADALAAGPAAAHDGGPILLTTPDELRSDVAEEIRRLTPDRIVVVGGVGSVSAAVVAALGEIAPTERVAGSDRYATAANVATSAFPDGADVAYIATGAGFADALAAGPAAAHDGAPVLLAARDGLPAVTEAALRRLAPSRIVVLGGIGAISAPVASALADIASVERIAGDDRYETAVAVADATGFTSTTDVFLASGVGFADALAAGPLAAQSDSPILLMEPTCMPASVWQAIGRRAPGMVTLLGGTAAISNDAPVVLCGGAVPPPLPTTTSTTPPTTTSTTTPTPEPLTPDRLHASYVVRVGEEHLDETIEGIQHVLDEADDWFEGQTGERLDFVRDDDGEIAVELAEAETLPSMDDAELSALLPTVVDIDGDELPVIFADLTASDSPCGVFLGNAVVMWMPSCDIYPDPDASFPFGATYLAAHELTHALGAVPDCAPHEVSIGHVDDDPADILYSGPLDREWEDLQLDPGHDDYFQHGRADCADIMDSEYWL